MGVSITHTPPKIKANTTTWNLIVVGYKVYNRFEYGMNQLNTCYLETINTKIRRAEKKKHRLRTIDIKQDLPSWDLGISLSCSFIFLAAEIKGVKIYVIQNQISKKTESDENIRWVSMLSSVAIRWWWLKKKLPCCCKSSQKNNKHYQIKCQFLISQEDHPINKVKQ